MQRENLFSPSSAIYWYLQLQNDDFDELDRVASYLVSERVDAILELSDLAGL